MYICTFQISTYIHTYIHTHHTYIHTHTHTYINTYIFIQISNGWIALEAGMKFDIHTYTPYIHTYIYTYIHASDSDIKWVGSVGGWHEI